MSHNIKATTKVFWIACQKGLPMTWRTLVGGVQVLIVLLGLVGIFVAPMGITNIDSTALRYLVWVAWGFLVVFCAVVIGLTPYRGQKAITEEQASKYEEALKEKDGVIDEYTNDFFRVNKENEELKQQLKNR